MSLAKLILVSMAVSKPAAATAVVRKLQGCKACFHVPFTFADVASNSKSEGF